MDLTPVTLRGQAVRLEPLSLIHLDALTMVGADSAIWRWTTGGSGSPQEITEFVESALELQQAGSALPFATIDATTDQVVGCTRFGNIVPEHKRVEIGWTWIAPAWQRTAINTEAKYLMLSHAFDQFGCNRVELKTSSLNARSRAAILRIGAKEEGTLRAHMVNVDGSLRDTVYFSVIAAEWPEVAARLQAMLHRRP